MDSWPYNLPQEWYYPDTPPDFKPVDNTIRTANSTGPAKLRRRFTANVENVVLTGTLNQDEVQILKDFIKITLQEVLTFAWVDHRTGSQTTQPTSAIYRFAAGWSSVETTHYAGDIWTVAMTLEMMPS